MINHPKLIAEYRKIPEHVFSSRVAFEAVCQYSLSLVHFLLIKQAMHQKYTFHPLVVSTPRYYIPIIRSQLTRSIAKVTPDIHDEVVAAFDEYFPINVDGGTFPRYRS